MVPVSTNRNTHTAKILLSYLLVACGLFQMIMKRLIKRYIIKARADKESDEITEGRRASDGLGSSYCFTMHSFSRKPQSKVTYRPISHVLKEAGLKLTG